MSERGAPCADRDLPGCSETGVEHGHPGLVRVLNHPSLLIMKAEHAR